MRSHKNKLSVLNCHKFLNSFISLVGSIQYGIRYLVSISLGHLTFIKDVHYFKDFYIKCLECMCVCARAHMYVCMCACVYVHIHLNY